MFKRFTPVTHSNIWTRPRGPRSAARFIGTSVIGVMRQGPAPTSRSSRSSSLPSFSILPSFLPSHDSSNAKFTSNLSLSLSILDEHLDFQKADNVSFAMSNLVKCRLFEFLSLFSFSNLFGIKFKALRGIGRRKNKLERGSVIRADL